MAAYEVLLLNTAIPQIQAAQSGDTYLVPRDIAFSAALTLSAGTANGVPYLNASKVLTTGSVLTFDGNTLGVSTAVTALTLNRTGAGTALVELQTNGTVGSYLGTEAANNFTIYNAAGGQLATLNATGLGIGTNNPAYKLQVANNGNFNTTVNVSNTTAGASSYARFLSISDAGSASFGMTSTTYTDVASAADALLINAGNASGGMVFAHDGVGKMTLDSSGNLGLGVTPKTDWSANYDAFQLGGGSSLSGHTSTSLNFTVLASNQYVNTAGTSKFINDGYAPRYLQRGDTGEHYWYTTNSGLAGGNVTNTQAMTLDASGNLGVGTTNPQSRLDVARADSSTYDAGNMLAGGQWQRISNSDTTANNSTLLFFNPNGAWSAIAGINTGANSGTLAFGTRNSGGNLVERARITSGGYFKASDNGAYTGISSSYHEFYQTADSVALLVRATNGSYTSSVLEINGDRATTNATYNLISAYNGPISGQFIVRDSGNAVNTTGTYGTISDQKLKQDIVDAGSQWADIKAVRFRKFKMKNDSTGLLQLGVVAQELEQTSPGLVEEHTDRDREGNDLGTTTKSVKTSVLLMKAAVALQEAMARIEKLEAEVAALKGA